MKAAQYKRLREAVGPQDEVANMLKVHKSTISKRERGEIPVTREAEMAMRYLYERRQP